jgi:hypothetical protein
VSNQSQYNKKQAKKKAPQLTPEEQAKVLAAQQAAAKEAENERERVELYGKSVEKMSHRQLRSELVKTIKREYAGKPPEPQAGMTIAFASILLTVFDNTKTSTVFETDRKGKPTRVARPDQINPHGKLEAYPV